MNVLPLTKQIFSRRKTLKFINNISKAKARTVIVKEKAHYKNSYKRFKNFRKIVHTEEIFTTVSQIVITGNEEIGVDVSSLLDFQVQ